MAEPTPNPSKTTEPTPPTPPTPPEPPAPNNGDNQKAIDDAVAAAKEKWEKELEQKLKDAENEGMRKAKLTNEQRKKEDDDKERAERQSLNVKKSLHMPKQNLPKSDCLPRLQSTL